MEIIVGKMKILLNKMEKALVMGNQTEIATIAQKLENLASELVAGSGGANAQIDALSLKEKDTPAKAAVEVDKFEPKASKGKSEGDIYYYKPTLVDDPYRGDYLDRFIKERSIELKQGGILEAHNSFWLDYEVQRGNVFGAIPQKLLSKEAENFLISRGWRQATVNYFEVVENMEDSELNKALEKRYPAYLLIKLKADQKRQVFVFNRE